MEENKYNKIADNFMLKGEILSIIPYGEGLINSTFLVQTSVKKYILQKINVSLFKDVSSLMNNISLVTDYLHKKHPNKQCLHIIKTKDNKLFYKTGNEYYRIYHFVKNSYSINKVDSAYKFYLVAKAFGEFMNNFIDFDASQLVEIIPNFHNTKMRYQTFLKAIEEDPFDRKKNILREIDFVIKRKDYSERILKHIEKGDIPIRVTHNDTKLNNILFDKDNDEPIAIVDLDTVMPGSVLHDIGDSLRFGANATVEDDTNLDHVKFKMDYFEAYIKGYLEKYHPTPIEKENIAFSAILLTYECGMRFLTDYLLGDTYFKISRPNHNLDRARNQFRLIEEMEVLLPKMEEIVNRY